MSIYLQQELWVVVQESERPNAPVPRPLSSGFSTDKAYQVLGLHCPSETSEAYLILCNDRNELWFVSNQHFRIAEGDRFVRGAVRARKSDNVPGASSNGSKNGTAEVKIPSRLNGSGEAH